MSRRVHFLCDVDGTLLVGGNPPVMNPDIIAVLKCHPDALKDLYSAYWAFQGADGNGDDTTYIRKLGARLRIMSEAEREGVHFRTLVASASPLDNTHSQHGDRLLAFERDYSRQIQLADHHHSHSRIAQLVPINDIDAFIAEDRRKNESIEQAVLKGVFPEQADANELTYLQDIIVLRDQVIAFMTPEKLLAMAQALGIERSLMRPSWAYKTYEQLTTAQAAEAAEDVAKIAKERAVLLFMHGKGAMFLHALKQYTEKETVVVFDDKPEVLAMIDVLKDLPQYQHLNIIGISVNPKRTYEDAFVTAFISKWLIDNTHESHAYTAAEIEALVSIGKESVTSGQDLFDNKIYTPLYNVLCVLKQSIDAGENKFEGEQFSGYHQLFESIKPAVLIGNESLEFGTNLFKDNRYKSYTPFKDFNVTGEQYDRLIDEHIKNDNTIAVGINGSTMIGIPEDPTRSYADAYVVRSIQQWVPDNMASGVWDAEQVTAALSVQQTTELPIANQQLYNNLYTFFKTVEAKAVIAISKLSAELGINLFKDNRYKQYPALAVHNLDGNQHAKLFDNNERRRLVGDQLETYNDNQKNVAWFFKLIAVDTAFDCSNITIKEMSAVSSIMKKSMGEGRNLFKDHRYRYYEGLQEVNIDGSKYQALFEHYVSQKFSENEQLLYKRINARIETLGLEKLAHLPIKKQILHGTFGVPLRDNTQEYPRFTYGLDCAGYLLGGFIIKPVQSAFHALELQLHRAEINADASKKSFKAALLKAFRVTIRAFVSPGDSFGYARAMTSAWRYPAMLVSGMIMASYVLAMFLAPPAGIVQISAGGKTVIGGVKVAKANWPVIKAGVKAVGTVVVPIGKGIFNLILALPNEIHTGVKAFTMLLQTGMQAIKTKYSKAKPPVTPQVPEVLGTSVAVRTLRTFDPSAPRSNPFAKDTAANVLPVQTESQSLGEAPVVDDLINICDPRHVALRWAERDAKSLDALIKMNQGRRSVSFSSPQPQADGKSNNCFVM